MKTKHHSPTVLIIRALTVLSAVILLGGSLFLHVLKQDPLRAQIPLTHTAQTEAGTSYQISSITLDQTPFLIIYDSDLKNTSVWEYTTGSGWQKANSKFQLPNEIISRK